MPDIDIVEWLRLFAHGRYLEAADELERLQERVHYAEGTADANIARAKELEAEIAQLKEQRLRLFESHMNEIERLREALESIVQWSEAYPLDIFHEPSKEEFKKAHEVLTANGMTLDAISASAMRHVVEGVGKIATRVLKEKSDD